MIELKEITDSNRLFTYKVAYDGGSAPNPFHGLCTLAICKPVIRRVAKKGDVIVGLGCGSDQTRIVYCMVVDEVVTWDDYIKGCQTGLLNNRSYNIQGKIPKNAYDQGDCIWKKATVYHESLNSWSGHSGEEDFNTDVKNGENVILGEIFWYFGKGDQYNVHLPKVLGDIIPGRGHRSNSNSNSRKPFVNFFNKMLIEEKISNTGKLGSPALEPATADKKTCSRCRAEERKSDACGEE